MLSILYSSGEKLKIIVLANYIDLVFPDSNCYRFKYSDNKTIDKLEFTYDSPTDIEEININKWCHIGYLKVVPKGIIKTDLNTFRIVLDRPNFTGIYICPLIFDPVTLNNLKHFIINSYIFNNGIRIAGNKIILMTIKRDLSKDIQNLFLNTKNYVETINFNDGYLGYVYRINKIWDMDVDLLVDGKYSLISTLAKERILNFYLTFSNVEDIKNTIIYCVLHKKESYRLKLQKDLDVTIPEYQELDSIFDKKRESIPFDTTDTILGIHEF